MLQFINDNGVLFSGVFAVVTALITAITSMIVNNRRSKQENMRKLQEQLEEERKKLNKYIGIEEQEKFIEKKTGSIYVEILPDGSKRNICGYCWERERVKMPLIMGKYYSEEERRVVEHGSCGNCKATCYDQ